MVRIAQGPARVVERREVLLDHRDRLGRAGIDEDEFDSGTAELVGRSETRYAAADYGERAARRLGTALATLGV